MEVGLRLKAFPKLIILPASKKYVHTIFLDVQTVYIEQLHVKKHNGESLQKLVLIFQREACSGGLAAG